MEKQFIMVEVKSSNVGKVGYDEGRMVLRIEFLRGGVYDYYGVPGIIFEDMMMSGSVGGYAKEYIFGVYETKKVA